MPTFYDQLKEAQFENRTSDPTLGTKGRSWVRTDTTPVEVKFDDGAAARAFVTKDNTQTLTNKTLTSPVVTALTGTIGVGTDIDLGAASNTSRITIAKGTFAAISALTRKQGTLLYASDTDKIYKDTGASLIELSAAAGGAVATKTASYTLSDSDDLILVDNRTNDTDIIITLPSAATLTHGKEFTIKKIDTTGGVDASARRVNINTSSGQKIDFSVSQIILSVVDQAIRLKVDANNSRWYRI